MSQTKTTFNFGKLLKVLIAVLTAIAGALGVASCSAKNDNVNENRENVSLQIHNSQLMAHRS